MTPNAQKVASIYRVAQEWADEGFVGDYWGSAGAGMLFTTGEKILLLRRSRSVEQPGTWGIPGGAIPVGSNGPMPPLAAALKESREEVGSVPSHQVTDKYVFQDGDFRFTSFIAKVREEFTPRLNWENSDHGWFARNELPANLHFGVKALLRSKDPFEAPARVAHVQPTIDIDMTPWGLESAVVDAATNKTIALVEAREIEPKGHWIVQAARVFDPYRGEGYGTEAYMAAIKYATERGVGLVQTDAASPDALKVRARVQRRGIKIQSGFVYHLVTGDVFTLGNPPSDALQVTPAVLLVGKKRPAYPRKRACSASVAARFI